MNKTITPDMTADKTTDYEELVKQLLAEMERANEKMDREQEEIERLKAETSEILTRLQMVA